MIEPRDKPPGNMQHLNRLIAVIAADTRQLELRLRTAVANTVVGQLLPEGAIKGGTAMKLRLGHVATRFTPDLDFARHATMEQFLSDLRGSLTKGWNGFTGRLVEAPPAKPKDVPVDYVMKPFDVKLEYKNRSWCTVKLEVGHDEIGDTDDPPRLMADDMIEVFRSLGLPAPEPMPVVAVEHQTAQKLHAASAPGSPRAHDLVDLQLLMTGEVDLLSVRATCERLFHYRRKHAWPPALQVNDEWDTLYTAAREGVPGVAADVDAAVRWTNDLVDRIKAAE